MPDTARKVRCMAAKRNKVYRELHPAGKNVDKLIENILLSHTSAGFILTLYLSPCPDTADIIH